MHTYYAGIGSRETPDNVLACFVKLAAYLSIKGFTLRSGGAAGADRAFEEGCNKVKGKKEIYLPWYGFEKSDSKLVVSDAKAFELGKKFHPNWDRLSDGAKKLQARNCHQVLGADLETPSRLIVCWTKNGSGQGGTGQALRIAKYYNIPVFDAGKYKSIAEIKTNLREFMLSQKILSENDIKK